MLKSLFAKLLKTFIKLVIFGFIIIEIAMGFTRTPHIWEKEKIAALREKYASEKENAEDSGTGDDTGQVAEPDMVSVSEYSGLSAVAKL